MKNFNINFISFIVIIFCNYNCKSTESQSINFCEIYKNDQSLVFSKMYSEEKNEANHSKRVQIFLKNYQTIKNFSDKHGFPKVNEGMQYTKDSCKYLSIFATFIHIGQTKPDLFYSEENITFLSNAIDLNLLDNSILYTAVNMSSFSSKCISLKPYIEKAILRWKLNQNLINNFNFVEC